SSLTGADGASNTLMFGETLGGDVQPGSTQDLAFSWMGAGALPTAWGLPTQSGTGGWTQFSSAHRAAVNFCFGDGSVHAIANTVDYATFIYASGWNDGAVFNMESLTN